MNNLPISQSPNLPISVGLIGYGMAGQVFHAPSISVVPGLQLAKVVERRGEEVRKRYPTVEIVRDAEGVFGDPAIDLVVIATPNSSHAELARRALLAGKHVVVDKPLTTTSAEADELIALAQQQGRVLSVYQNRRWDSDFQTVQAIVRSGHLGRLVDYEARYERYRPALKANAWREEAVPGSGLLYDLGSHLIDQALVLFGLPQTVNAIVRVQREGAQADDQFSIVLGYGELTAVLRSGMLVREPGPHFALHGTRGSFIKYGMDIQEAALKAGALPGGPGWGVEPPELWGSINTELDGLRFTGKIESLPGNYQGYYEQLYATLSTGTPLAVTAEQGRNTIRIIELARQSSAEGRTIGVGN
jgi:scyllo-inositol 2-dehydrogenase (NADP+)